MAEQLHDAVDELASLFSTTFKDKWMDDERFSLYINQLCACSVQQLVQEPERLEEERQHTLQKTQELAFHNYKTFVETAECSRKIFQDFNEVESHVQSLLGRLPIFKQKCEVFEKSAHEIAASRKSNSVLLMHHTKLLEILEIPQLMDTCVRNGYYEEALELSSYVKQLERKHTGLSIIQSIVTDVSRCSQLMLTQLLQQFRTNIQLPACLKLVGYLRRLDVFSETGLRIKFLQARDAWFQAKLNEVPLDNPYHHIDKTMELSRVHLFDIITQYRAIFSDDELLAHSQVHPSDRRAHQPGLLHSWVIQKVSSFLSVLEWNLQRGVGGRLDSLLGQCMYFGMSLGRVGADFRSLAAPIFQKAALQSFTETVKVAVEKFETSMKTYTPSSSVVGFSSNISSSILPLAPPHSISEYAFLARLTNTMLTAFNDLRQCAPVGISADVVACVKESLVSIVQVVCQYYRYQHAALDSSEKDVVENLCRCVKLCFVPFIVRCVESLFPPQLMALYVGYNQQTTNEHSEGKITIQLKVAEIIHPLLDIVPDEDIEVMDNSITQSMRLEPTGSSMLTLKGVTKDSPVNDGNMATAVYATAGPLADDILPKLSQTTDHTLDSNAKGQLETEISDNWQERQQTEAHEHQSTVINSLAEISPDDSFNSLATNMHQEPALEQT